MDIFEVILSKKVEKTLVELPAHITLKLLGWVKNVKEFGLNATRKIPGYHDEPIKGKARKGQRSIRLNKAYRAFYIIDENHEVHFIEVIEVNKHEY
jgi:proteic killer suppression protein